MLTEQDLLMEVLQRIDLRYKTSLDLSGNRMSNPKFKRGKGNNSPTEKTTCGKCGKKYNGDCLKGTDNYFCCGKSGHKVRDFPHVKNHEQG